MLYRKLRPLLLAILTLALLPLMPGCMRSYDLNERLLIQAIGIDRHEDVYKFTLQAFLSEGSSGTTGVEASKSNVKLITVYGSTISEGLSNVKLVHGKTPFYGQNKYIAIGRSVADDDIERVLAFFVSGNQSRMGTDVVMADGEAAELLALHLPDSMTPALSVQRMLQSDSEHGKLCRSTLMDVTSSFELGLAGCSLPVLTPIEGENETDGLIYCRGTALFRDGSRVGEIDTYQTRGLMWVIKNITSGIVAFIDSENVDVAAVRVKRCGVRISADIVEGVPHFHVKLKTKGSLTELLLKTRGEVTPEIVSEVERYVAEYIESEIERAYSVIAVRHRCDLFRMGTWLKKHEERFWKENCDRWEDILPLTTLDAELELGINRFDLKS